jgi:hypothetical protein
VAHRVLATGGDVIFMTPVCFVGKIPDDLYRGAGKELYFRRGTLLSKYEKY